MTQLDDARSMPRERTRVVVPGHSRLARTNDPLRLYSLRVPIFVFLVSRIAFGVLGRISSNLLTASTVNPSVLPTNDPLARAGSWTSPWFRFDTGWYVGIAEHGYHWGSLATANTNFLPLFPLLIRAVQPLAFGSAWVAAWLISNVAALLATILMWRWATGRWGETVGRNAVLLLTVFPFGFFFVAPYTESLFLALALAAFTFAEQDRWVSATCMAGLCTITRPVGLAVVVGLIVIAVRGRNMRAAWAAPLGLVPLVVFAAYLAAAFDQPFGFLTYHSAGWVPPHGTLWTTLGSQFQTNLSPWDRVDVFMAVLFVISVPLVWRRIGVGYAAYSLVAVALPLVHGLVSMERYVTVIFPVMASWSTWRSQWAQFVLFSVSLLALILATTLFLTGASIF